MINDAHVFFAGYVATEPSFRLFENGATQTRLRVAYTARRFSRETGQWTDGPTSFVTVLCWRQLANNVAMCVRKGEPVVVKGRLHVKRYQHRDGTPRVAVDVEASSVGHDLSRGVAQFSRIRKPVGATAAENAGLQMTPGRQAGAGDGVGAGPQARSAQEVPPGSAAGDVVDEQAVAEFARELSEFGEAHEGGHFPGEEGEPAEPADGPGPGHEAGQPAGEFSETGPPETP